MGKNNGGGSKYKRGKKNVIQNDTVLLRSVEDNEFYAHVMKVYGNGQCGVQLVAADANQILALSDKEYRGRISGRMRRFKRRNFVNKDDFVLVAKRDYEEDKVDIIHVYRPEAVRKLVKMGHLPDIERVGCGDMETSKSAFEFSDEGATGATAASTATTSGADASDAPLVPAPTTFEAPPSNDWEVDIDEI